MYRAFKLKPTFELDDDIVKAGGAIYKRNKKAVSETLHGYIDDGGSLDAEAIQHDWFATVDSDVFISHSHADEDTAYFVAALLERVFGLKAFVDSAIWHNSADLLRTIDNEYSWYNKPEGIYSYEKTSRSAAHVHMMLATSLTKMIERSEAVFFLQTDESITSEEAVKSKTKSPWIYHELEVIRTIEIRPPGLHRGEQVKFAKEERASLQMLQVSYPANFDRFTNLSVAALVKWIERRKGFKDRHSLDLLYDILPAKDSFKTLLFEEHVRE